MEFVEIEWRSKLYEQEIELRDQLLRAPLGLTFTEQDLEAESEQLHFGMLDQRSLIACAVIVPLSDARAKLRQMAVIETSQRRGIGSKLIHNIESVLNDREFKWIELHARDTAIGFYQRLGYHKQGAEFTEVSIPHWKLVKPVG